METPRVTPAQLPEWVCTAGASLSRDGRDAGFVLGTPKWGESKESPGFGKHTRSAHAERMFGNKPRFPKHLLAITACSSSKMCISVCVHSPPPKIIQQ